MDIPDEIEDMQPELVALLNQKLPRFLGDKGLWTIILTRRVLLRGSNRLRSYSPFCCILWRPPELFDLCEVTLHQMPPLEHEGIAVSLQFSV